MKLAQYKSTGILSFTVQLGLKSKKEKVLLKFRPASKANESLLVLNSVTSGPVEQDTLSRSELDYVLYGLHYSSLWEVRGVAPLGSPRLIATCHCCSDSKLVSPLGGGWGLNHLPALPCWQAAGIVQLIL